MNLDTRKREHLDLALESRMEGSRPLPDFDYEPLFAAHPQSWKDGQSPMTFLGKSLRAPFWISSMTGGTKRAREINNNLARAVGEFGLGMGLGSVRPLLNFFLQGASAKSSEFRQVFADFHVRPVAGEAAPLLANLGIAQLEELVERGRLQALRDLVGELDADGLIIHLNPLQEWFQPEGDRLRRPALETLTVLLEEAPWPVVVKEVGQGMGPRSLAALMELPLGAIEFGAFGGTNFSRLEILRAGADPAQSELALVGHDAREMVQEVSRLVEERAERACRHFIISGGIRSVLHGYALAWKCPGTSLIGRAGDYLVRAQKSYADLADFIRRDLETLAMAKRFLRPRSHS